MSGGRDVGGRGRELEPEASPADVARAADPDGEGAEWYASGGIGYEVRGMSGRAIDEGSPDGRPWLPEGNRGGPVGVRNGACAAEDGGVDDAASPDGRP